MPIFYVYVLTTGFLSLSFEILAMRLFIPIVGSGTEQTSFIIGAVLLFYALGNLSSSRDKSPRALKRNFLLLSFSYAVTVNHAFVASLASGLRFLGLTNFHLSLSLLCLVILAPISYLFGETFPLLLKETRDLPKAIAANTLGSFLGAVGTSTLLVYLLSASMMTFGSLCVILILTAAFVKAKVRFLLAIPLAVSAFANFILTPRMLTGETGVATYEVVEASHRKALSVNGSRFSSAIYKHGNIGASETIHDMILHSHRKREVLILGAGGFTLSFKNRQHHFTYVDIDPKMKEVVQKTFNPEATGDYVYADAREYLLKNSATFDLIVQDTFTSDYEQPLHLSTLEHFRQVQRRLNPKGMFVIHLFHEGSLRDNHRADKIVSTLHEVFGNCYYIPVLGDQPLDETRERMHTYGMCFKEKRPPVIYSDDRYHD